MCDPLDTNLYPSDNTCYPISLDLGKKKCLLAKLDKATELSALGQGLGLLLTMENWLFQYGSFESSVQQAGPFK